MNIENKSDILIHVDGGFDISHNIGGWGVVITTGDVVIEKMGSKRYTDSNEMELEALVQAIETVETMIVEHIIPYVGYTRVTVYTDSAYVRHTAMGWLKDYINSGEALRSIKYKQLWDRYVELITYIEVTFVEVKSKSVDLLSIKADALATEAISIRKKKLTI